MTFPNVRGGPRWRDMRAAGRALAALCWGTLAAQAALAQDVGRSGVRLEGTFGLSMGYTETSHSPSRDGHDLTLQASPGLRLSSGSGRIRGSGAYSLNLVRHSNRGESSSEVQNNLNAAFTIEAVSNWLYVDTGATVSQRALSAFGQQSADGSLQRNDNRTEVGSVYVRPHAQGQIAGFAVYELRLDAFATNARDSIEGDSTSTNTSFSLRSSDSAALLGWGASVAKQRSSFRAGRSTETQTTTLSLSLRPDPEVRFGVHGGEDKTDVGASQTFRHTSWGYDAGWTPNERTQASLSTSRRYFGHSHQFSFSHRLPQSALQFSSVKDVSNGSDPNGVGQPITLYQLYFFLFATQEPDPILRDLKVLQFLQLLGQDPNTIVSGGFVTNAVTLQRRQDLGWTYSGRRITLGLQAFASSTSVLDNPNAQQPDEGQISQRGYVGSVSYRLTPTASVSLAGSRMMTKATTVHPSTDLKSMSLNLTEQLTRKIAGSAGVRYSVFNSPTDPYREVSVTAAMSMAF